MKQQNFFYYQLSVDLNEMYCVPYMVTGKIIKETETNFIAEDNNGNKHWFSKDVFTGKNFSVIHTPGDDECMNDLGYDTYLQGYLWYNEKTEVENKICQNMVSNINIAVKTKIQNKIDTLLKNMNMLDKELTFL